MENCDLDGNDIEMSKTSENSSPSVKRDGRDSLETADQDQAESVIERDRLDTETENMIKEMNAEEEEDVKKTITIDDRAIAKRLSLLGSQFANHSEFRRLPSPS